MGINENGKRNGYHYTKKKLKNSIENNKFFRDVRKKLIEEKLKKKMEK